jgi:hypothetical protein
MSLEEIKKQLTALDNKMTLVDAKIDRILELVETDCKKMREHIDFVETVYDKVKTPFNYVMDRVSYLVYNDDVSLTIANNQDQQESETKKHETKEADTKKHETKEKDQ